jgi:hypothetical protein
VIAMDETEITEINKTRKSEDRIIMTEYGPFDPVYDRHRCEDGGGPMSDGYMYDGEGRVVKKPGPAHKLMAALAKIALFFAKR